MQWFLRETEVPIRSDFIWQQLKSQRCNVSVGYEFII